MTIPQKDVIRMAREAGGTAYTNRHYPNEPAFAFSNGNLQRFVELVAVHEREECAKVCDDRVLYTGYDCAEAIRARGQA